MTEDELLEAVMDTLAIRRATSRDTVYQHARRSDRALIQGQLGLPDIVGVVGRTLIAWELKTERGHVEQDQYGWQLALSQVDALDVRIVRPADLDELVDELLRHRLLGRRRAIRPLGAP